MSTEPLHLLIALQRFHAGGAERQVLYLAKGLQQKAIRVSILAFGQKTGLSFERFTEAGITTYATGFSEKLILGPKPLLKKALLKWKYRQKLIRLVKQLKVDVIIPFTYAPNIIYGAYWKRMGAKACYWNQRDEGRWFKGRPWEINTLNSSTGIVSNNLEGKLFLEKFTKKSITIIHNGVHLPETLANPDNGKALDIIMVANLKRFKDHVTLLKAWKILNDKNALQKAQLLLAGREGNMTETLKEFVSANNLETSVQFLGQVMNVNAVLQRSHICAFSSVTEGVPNGVLECMAMGLPVVATDILGIREALGEDYPYLAKPHDAEDFANKLLVLMQDSLLRQTIGAKNRMCVEQCFPINQMVNNYYELISHA